MNIEQTLHDALHDDVAWESPGWSDPLARIVAAHRCRRRQHVAAAVVSAGAVAAVVTVAVTQLHPRSDAAIVPAGPLSTTRPTPAASSTSSAQAEQAAAAANATAAAARAQTLASAAASAAEASAGPSVAPGQHLVAAYGPGPAARGCTTQTAPVPLFKVEPDTPQPDCVQVAQFTAVDVTNRTGDFGQRARTIRVTIEGASSATIAPGQTARLRPDNGAIFAWGLHCLRVNIYPGSCLSIWVKPAAH